MRSEIRNELLLIKSMVKSNDKKDKELDLCQLLDRFEYDIKDQLEEVRHKEEELKSNLETLEYVKKELGL